MPNLTYSVYSNYPRIKCRDTDKSSLTTRTSSADSWKSLWDDWKVPNTGAHDVLMDASNTTWRQYYAHDEKCLLMGLYGWIENDSDTMDRLLNFAKWLVDQTPYSGSGDEYDDRALAYCYDFLRAGASGFTFSEADRKYIGDRILSKFATTRFTSPSKTEWWDGHLGSNLSQQLALGIVLYGESGANYNYTSSAAQIIDEALNWYYGENPGDNCARDAKVFWSGDGGHWSGAHYAAVNAQHALKMLEAIHFGFVRNVDTPGSLQYLGEDYEPWADEPYVATLGSWVANCLYRHGAKAFPVHDDYTSANPWFEGYYRHMIGLLARRGGDWRKVMVWIRNQYQNASQTGTGTGEAYDFIHFDPADTDNTATSPHLLATPPAKTTWHANWGQYWYKSTWDYPNAVTVMIQTPKLYYQGHADLATGSICIAVGKDMVLFRSGKFPGSSDMYGEHYNYWYQASIGHSGVPLIDDGSYTHWNYFMGYSNRQKYHTSLGGQVHKRYTTGGTTYYDPPNYAALTTWDGGDAWKRSEPDLKESTDDYDFFYTDIRRAYTCMSSEVGTSTERVRECDIRFLIIKREYSRPIIFRVVRIVSRQPSFIKRDIMHGSKPWAITFPHADENGNGDTLRGQSIGYWGEGKIIYDIYHPSDYDISQIIEWYVGDVNYTPVGSANAKLVDTYESRRLQVDSRIERTTEFFVTVLWPMFADEAPLSYEWIDEPNWFGLRFTDSAHEYRIHKTDVEILAEGGGGDTTPPAPPSGLTATPGNTQVRLNWSPNTESDIASYKVWYREKV